MTVSIPASTVALATGHSPQKFITPPWYDFLATIPPGGGISEVNGQFGPIVTLTYSDVGADPAGAAASAQSNAEAFATSADAVVLSTAENFATAMALVLG